MNKNRKKQGEEQSMKLIFASDSFKGSLSSKRTAELLSRAAREVFGALNGEKAQHNYP